MKRSNSTYKKINDYYPHDDESGGGRAAGNDRSVMSISRLGLRSNDTTIVIRVKCRCFTLIKERTFSTLRRFSTRGYLTSNFPD